MENFINGRVIMITGASNGFGRLTAKKAALLGCKVVCCARREERLKELVDEIHSDGGEATYVVADVRNLGDLQKAVEIAVEKYGAVDCLLNSAGTMPGGNFMDHKKGYDAWMDCIDINLKGTINGICAVYDQMMTQGRGQVINLASIWAAFPLMGNTIYQATKTGVVYITESLRQESQGVIKTTVIRPSSAPDTELSSRTVVCKGAVNNILTDMDAAIESYKDSDSKNPDSAKCSCINADILTDGIIYVMNQPWGVSISDLTVRATGEFFTL